jgi:hypothetical protein
VIPVEAVEAAAKALWRRGRVDPWEGARDYITAEFREDALIALEAAAPYMLAVAWEEGRLVGRAEEQSGFDTEMNPYGDPYMLNNEGEK